MVENARELSQNYAASVEEVEVGHKRRDRDAETGIITADERATEDAGGYYDLTPISSLPSDPPSGKKIESPNQHSFDASHGVIEVMCHAVAKRGSISDRSSSLLLHKYF